MSVEAQIKPVIMPDLELAPFAVLRVAGLSVSRVREIFGGALVSPLALARTAQTVMSAHREYLEDVLFNWVKALEGDKFRHRVLALRRDIHNDRVSELACDREVVTRIAAYEPMAVEPLSEWDHAVRQWHAALGEIRGAELYLDSSDFAETLLPLFGNERFARGLSHSCPMIFRNRDRVLSGKMKPSARAGFVNTVLSYVVRAGTKTSPLTTFMQCCLLDIDPEKEVTVLDFSQAKLRAVSTLDRSFFLEFRERLITGSPHAATIPLQRNPTLHFIEDTLLRFWAPTYSPYGGHIWRRNILVQLKVSSAVATMLSQFEGEAPASAVSGALVGLGVDADHACRLVHVLLKKGALVTRPSPSENLPALAQAHAKWSREVMPEIGEDVHSAILRTESDGSRFADFTIPERIAVASRLSVAAVGTAPDVETSSEIEGTVLENSWWDSAQGSLGLDFERSVRKALSAIGSRLLPSTEYVWIRDFFVGRYGAGGTCRNVLEFLGAVGEAFPKDRRELWQSGAGRDPRLDLGGWCMPISFHVQLMQRDLHFPHEPNVVINAVYPRGVWQLSRYTVSPSDRSLTERLRRWLAHCTGPDEAVAVLIGSEDVSLQNYGPLTDRVIDFDRTGESAGFIDVAALELQHDRDSGRLICRERGGATIRPLYLGGTMPDPHLGPAYFLALLGEPLYVRLAPPRLTLSSTGQVETVRHQRRIVEDGCILLRETWFIKSRDLLAVVSSADFAACAVLLDRFFRTRGIALEGFVFGRTNDVWRNMAPDIQRYRKPMWFSLANAWCVRRIMRIAAEMDYVVIREAVPSLDHAAVIIDGEPHVAEYHIEAALTLNATPKGVS